MKRIHFNQQEVMPKITKIGFILSIMSLQIIPALAQCIDSSKIVPGTACTEQYDPVCGCNNVTYSNSCHADANGVLSYTQGACPIPDDTSFFLVNPKIKVGDTTEISWNAKCKCAIDWSKYEAVSAHFYTANVIGNGKIIGLIPGVAEIRITELATKSTTTLFITVVSADEPTWLPIISYLPTAVTKDGLYNVSLYCRTELDCCNTHTLYATRSDQTITLSVTSTKINCPTQDLCKYDLQTEIKDLTMGEYYIKYGMNGILMTLGDTTSSQAYKFKPRMNIIATGQSTTLATVDNSAVDWTKFMVSSSNEEIAKVSDNGIIIGIKYGKAYISVKEISTGASISWEIWVESTASYFTKDSIYVLVGKTAQIPINYELQQDFVINDTSNAIVTVDTLTKTITAHAIGSIYYISINRNTGKRDSLKINVKEPIAPQTQIASVSVQNNGYTLEIVFDRPITLYEGIEKDFAIALDNSLKASLNITVTNATYKNGDMKTVLLTLNNPVPAIGFTVQLQDLKTFTVTDAQIETRKNHAEIKPNPAHSNIMVTAEGLISVQIYTLDGQQAISASARDNRAKINISHLLPGKYIVRCKLVSGVESQILIIE